METYFEREMLIQRKDMDEDTEDEDHFDSLETVSNVFNFGNFLWTLRLRPQPLLIPTTNRVAQKSSSWAAPIQKVLLQQRINNQLGQDLDHLGLSAFLERKMVSLPCLNNNKPQANSGSGG